MNWLHILTFVFACSLACSFGCDENDTNTADDEFQINDSSPSPDRGTDSDDQEGEARKEECPTDPIDSGRHELELQHDGKQREYILYVPETIDLDEPSPLVFNFHGYTSNMHVQEMFSAMNETASKNGFILVYPQGLVNEFDGETSWNAGGCCAYGEELTRDDVAFVRTLIEDVGQKLCVDRRKIYASGMSNGGFMSHYLACEASDVIAAVASVAGVMPISPFYCTPPRAVPVIHFHGTRDSVVPYGNEGEEVYLTSVQETFAGWAEINKCEDTARETFRNGDASCVTHSQCQDGVEVTLCTIEGMDHCWPGQEFCPYSSASTDISANDEIWKFFSRFSLESGAE